MDIYQLLELCKAYNDLGWSVQGQLHAIVEDCAEIDDQNRNALRLISKDFLKLAVKAEVEYADEEKDKIDAYLKQGDEAAGLKETA